MTLVELSVGAPPEFAEPLSQLLRRYAGRGVVIEQAGGYNPDEGEGPPRGAWITVRTYVPADSDLAGARAGIETGLRLIALVGEVGALTERSIEEHEWRDSYRRHLTALSVGRRLLVLPIWEDGARHRGREVIRLDPGLAFGTGHHPTTAMCLELIEQLVRPGCRVLDLGCGSGILAIAAAKLGAASVLCLDVEGQAVEAARVNLRRNGVDGAVRAERGTLPGGAGGGAFDLVVANISSRVVIDLAPHIAAVVAPGGSAVVSGVVADGADRVEGALGEAGLAVAEVRREGDWLAIRSGR